MVTRSVMDSQRFLTCMPVRVSESPFVFAVVDDDDATRLLFASLVRAAGDVVVEARSFSEGQIVLREYPWDVAIIDRSVPGGDGLDLCREVTEGRVGESHRHVVFLSADDAPDEKLRGFDAGADEYIARTIDPFELRARLRAIRRTVATQKALLARVASLEQLSVLDGLTQIYNHRFFQAELRRLFDLASRYLRPIALAMIDIDHFKNVNDTYGHRIGDHVLSEVSTALAGSVRSSDILARYGGEEFAALLPETTLLDAAVVAERLRTAVEAAVIQGNFGELRMTISIGIAALPAPGVDTAARFIEAADRALYFAKERGRNRVERHPLIAAAPVPWPPPPPRKAAAPC